VRDGDEATGDSTSAQIPAFIPWELLVDGEPTPIEYHWDGWVALATVAVLAGAGDSLKSWLCLYLAVMTAAERAPFAEPGVDAPPLRSGPVIYITAENGLQEERRRCRLLQAGLGLPDQLPLYLVPAESLSLGQDADYRGIQALVAKIRPVAIFVDSAIALSGIDRENDNVAVRTFMKTRILPLAREHGVTVYLVQHSPVDISNPAIRGQAKPGHRASAQVR